jgi:hypothetical protein
VPQHRETPAGSRHPRSLPTFATGRPKWPGKSSNTSRVAVDRLNTAQTNNRQASGIWAAVDAGLGITLRTATGLPKALKVMEAKSGLPRLPMVDVSLHDGGRALNPAATRFKEILSQTLS